MGVGNAVNSSHYHRIWAKHRHRPSSESSLFLAVRQPQSCLINIMNSSVSIQLSVLLNTFLLPSRCSSLRSNCSSSSSSCPLILLSFLHLFLIPHFLLPYHFFSSSILSLFFIFLSFLNLLLLSLNYLLPSSPLFPSPSFSLIASPPRSLTVRPLL